MSTLRSDRRELFLMLCTGLFIMSLIISNITSTKLFDFFGTGFILDGGAVVFPIVYVIGDVITEIFGFRTARRAIYITFLMNALAFLFLWIVLILPPAANYEFQSSYEAVVGVTFRIIVGSLIAFVIGQVLNSYVFVRIKAKTGSKWLWVRALGSSLVGDFVDTMIFITIAFVGTLPTADFIGLLSLAYVTKIVGQIILTPVTYLSVNLLRKQIGSAPTDENIRLADVVKV